MAEYCIKYKHINEANSYCDLCKLNFCDLCQKDHLTTNHTLIEYSKLFGKLIEEASNFKNNIDQVLKEKVEEKGQHEKLFQKEIEDHYQKQVESLSSLFRALHDQLHITEVGLKQELKSYYDDNVESYATNISKIDFEIEKLNQFVGLVDSNSENSKDDKEKESSFINEYIESSDEISKMIKESQGYRNSNKYNAYQKYSIGDWLDKQSDAISKMVLIKNISPQVIMPRDHLFLYIYNKGLGVKKLNLVTKEVIGFKSNQNLKEIPPLEVHYYQMNNIGGKGFYIFSKNLVYYFDFQTCEWTSFPVDLHQDVRVLSSIYDGHDHIYILGGYSIKSEYSHQGIYRFNINDKSFEAIAQMKHKDSYTQHLSFDDQGNLFILGGYIFSSRYLDRIDHFNVKTYEMKTLHDLSDLNYCNIQGGCYVANNKSWYLLNREIEFVKFDTTTNKIMRLEKPYHSNQMAYIYLRLHYDGLDTIYLLSPDEHNLLSFTISTNQWSSRINFGIESPHSISSWNNYFSFSRY